MMTYEQIQARLALRARGAHRSLFSMPFECTKRKEFEEISVYRSHNYSLPHGRERDPVFSGMLVARGGYSTLAHMAVISFAGDDTMTRHGLLQFGYVGWRFPLDVPGRRNYVNDAALLYAEPRRVGEPPVVVGGWVRPVPLKVNITLDVVTHPLPLALPRGADLDRLVRALEDDALAMFLRDEFLFFCATHR